MSAGDWIALGALAMTVLCAQAAALVNIMRGFSHIGERLTRIETVLGITPDGDKIKVKRLRLM
jgi:hypothetical protein